MLWVCNLRDVSLHVCICVCMCHRRLCVIFLIPPLVIISSYRRIYCSMSTMTSSLLQTEAAIKQGCWRMTITPFTKYLISCSRHDIACIFNLRISLPTMHYDLFIYVSIECEWKLCMKVK